VEVLLLDRGEVSGATTGLGEGNVLRADAPDGHAVWLELAARFPEAVNLRAKGSLTLYEGEPTLPGERVDDPHLMEPALRPGFTGIYVEEDMQVDPRATAQAMAAVVPTRTHADVVRADAGGVELAGGERIAAEAVVLACGPWASELAPELDVRPRRGQLVALRGDLTVRHKVIDGTYPAPVAAVIEEALSGEIYVGSTRDDAGFDTGAPHQAALLERAVHFMPGLAGLPVLRTWVGFRPYRPDGPFAGRLESGVWAITGHEGAGIGNGPVDARALAQRLIAS
jgi:glycine/D-amino acid oxidase-like deaminating enzyme